MKTILIILLQAFLPAVSFESDFMQTKQSVLFVEPQTAYGHFRFDAPTHITIEYKQPTPTRIEVDTKKFEKRMKQLITSYQVFANPQTGLADSVQWEEKNGDITTIVFINR